MFISKTRYRSLQAIITDQNQTIQNLNRYIALLKNENNALKQTITYSEIVNDIDFPNSQKGGFEGSDIFTM